ncbi:MobF family relaxase [Nocardioides pakistanensis]
MGLVKLTAGDGYTYLTRQVAAHDATDRGHASLGDYYAEKGESPGRWIGSGLPSLGLDTGDEVTESQMKALFGEGRHPNSALLEARVLAEGGSPQQAMAAGALGSAFRVYTAAGECRTEIARAFTDYNLEHGRHWNTPVPPDVRAQIRTDIARRRFVEQHERPPADDRELAGFLAKLSRQSTTAVAGYDLTFSPVKSVSALWALAPPEVAEQVRAAHDAAVADTVAWIEREVAFTRVGNGGVRQVPVRGLVAAAFTHRDSRAGDPDLHTHVAVSNKVQTLDDRWLALDGRVLYRAKVAASEHYNTRLEAELAERLGVRFTERGGKTGKRRVREIAGIDPALTKAWSRRRAAIESRRARLATEFQDVHGRPPTAVEALALAQQATLETRDAKHAPRSESEQRIAWRQEAVSLLGSNTAVDRMVEDALREGPSRSAPGPPLPEVARLVVAEVEARRATWTVWHIRAEAQRQVRRLGLAPDALEQAVSRLVELCLKQESVRLDSPDPVREPAALRRPDGESVYEVHGAAIYTSRRILDAEQRILAAAERHDGRRISDVRVGIAVAEATANGTPLNEAQRTLVRRLATSGARVQLALAPAGTGKTTTMRVLTRAWTDSDGWVLGLAPSAAAAHELREAIEAPTDTLTKLTHSLHHLPKGQWPTWMQKVGPRTLVVLDEAGQAGTIELANTLDFLLNRGASVRLVGDDQQLAAVAAGGVLRDLARTTGVATLSEVRRFTDPAEAAATLAVRQGSPAALGYYADQGRIHVGDTGSATDQAYAAWAADRAAGLDTLLLAPTRDLVTQLNQRARAERLAAEESSVETRDEVSLCDGTAASVGDTIVTRRNERHLALTATDWVKNGDRWTVTAVGRDGSLHARHHQLRRSIVLPAEYVREHVQLGYAATVHAAQGQTTDTCHTVVSGEESRQLLYVALSRGRSANHLYLATADDGDPHNLVRRESLLPPTAIDVLATILQRDGSQHSASSTQHELASAAAQLHQAVLRYQDAVAFAAEQAVGEDALVALDAQAEALFPGLTRAPAYPTLRGNLALRAIDGDDPVMVLADALAERESDTAEDVAAVLDWRISTTSDGGPLPWLAALPQALATSADWGNYLRARASRVVSLAGQVRAEAAAWSLTMAPDWARPLTGRDADLSGDLAVWRASYAVPDDDTRPTGPRQLGADARRHQDGLDHRARSTMRGRRQGTWDALLPKQVTSDPHHRLLSDHLGSLDRAGLDVPQLVRNALAERRPLPTEVPADALWWRIVRHLGPTALHASGQPAADLRPAWTPLLAEHLGEDVAEQVMDAPAWPALAAAVHAAGEWMPDQLIGSVTNGLRDGDRFTMPPSELCEAMVWRIAALTDVPHESDDAPPDPLDDATTPPDDLHLLHVAPPPEPPGVGRARILELNQEASDYYVGLYQRSWAPAYLRDRLGSDLGNDTRFAVGYAPPGPTSLIRHLTSRGATVQELVEAGLARRTDRGHLVDAFKDRLVIPLREVDGVVGFIGRRNPTKDDSEYAGPKYLNTRSTAAFRKSEMLFGLVESSEELRGGAVPVIVEGPLDALAVTIAGGGDYVGVAPLGTAFTETQGTKLKPLLNDEPNRVVIATDPDAAGWLSAQRAFWQLAAMGGNPRYVDLPSGADPADLLNTQGADQVARRLKEAKPFAAQLLERLVAEVEESQSPASRLRLVREAGQIIGALPPYEWPQHIEEVTARASLPVGMLNLEVIDAGDRWTEQPREQFAQRTSTLLASARIGVAHKHVPNLWATNSCPPVITPSAAVPSAPALDDRASRKAGPQR